MPPARTSAKAFLPYAVVATFAVIVLPALTVSLIETSGRLWLLLTSVLIAMGLSVAIATVGSALWARRPNSKDFVFGDLMLWGWLRRVRAERRLAQAQGLLGMGGGDGQDLSREQRCKVLQRLSAMLEAKDAHTLGHSRRVTRHAERIARQMGLSREDVARVRIAASLHDVGKVHTPRHILIKPGPLTPEELEIMKRHPTDGAAMVAEIGDPDVTAMVRHHHERLDGSGYPEGLRGEGIPLGARIISVADTFDAITSDRSYHGARKHQRALEVVSQEGGSTLDPNVVAAFLSYYSGKRTVAWSAFGLTGPPRLASWASGLFSGVGGMGFPLSSSLAAIIAAALAGASFGGPAPPATAAGKRASDRDPSDAPGERRAERAPRDRLSPVSDGPGGAPRGDGFGNGSPETPSPSPGTGGTPGSPSPVPNVNAPSTPEPALEVPELEVPELEVPEVKVPDLSVPEVEVPNLEVPTVEVPLSEALPSTKPLVDELSKVQLPGVELD